MIRVGTLCNNTLYPQSLINVLSTTAGGFTQPTTTVFHVQLRNMDELVNDFDINSVKTGSKHTLGNFSSV